jgi:hypothetical protein
MKKFLIVLNILIWSLVGCQTSVYAAETKKVCKTNAKGKEVCKNIKIHKKFDGTKVPDKKDKKK